MTNMTTRDNVLERCEDIIKPKNDDRLYRGLVLKNTMKVLLISDPTTDKSAAALHIDIGYMNDPDDLPGLAHLCEHMLFLGNETYPEPNNYKQYLWENGGLKNAKTVFDHAVYYFHLNTSKLSSALDRFAQSFLTPLFPESLIKREVNAIHSEYMKYLTFDSYLLDQLERSYANPRHPFSKFGAGNRETLDVLPKQMGINVRQRLLEFHKKYYSANVMSLCVFGAETLDELEEMVVSLFSQVRNKEIEIPICYEHPFNDKHFRTKWYMVPVEDTKNLSVSFSILDLPKHCEKEPICYITYFLREKYAGSLFSALRRRGWCTSIQCGRQAQIPGSYILFLNMSLTEKGIDHIDDIITLMFQCINMLKKQGPVEWIYNEYRDLAKIYFPFKQKNNSESYMSYRASKLRKYPMKENLCPDFLYTQWKPELIDTILKCLTPKNIRVHVIGKAYEGVANETARCGIKYKKEKISTEIINMWENAGYNSEFHLPAKNVFIPSRFNLKPRDDRMEKFPTVIADTPFVRMWFKQDDKYLVPGAKMFFRFVSPYSQIDAVSFNLSSMHVKLSKYTFYETVRSIKQPVNLAGIIWILKYTLDGLILVIQGFDDKQHILLEKIVDCLLNFKNDQKIFEILKKKYIEGLRKSLIHEPYRNVHRNVYEIITESYLMREDLLRTAVYVTFDKFQEFIPQLFSKMHVECLIHGNIVKKEALDIATMIESKLKSAIPQITPLYQHQLALPRELKLDDGCHFLYQTFNEYHKDFCTTVYYQVGVQSVESDMLLKLLIQSIMKPCAAIRQTQAYAHVLLSNNVNDLKVTQGLLVVIQGNRHPRNVEHKIDSFIDFTLNFITKMSRNKFQQHKDTLLMSQSLKIKTLHDQADMFWGEIIKQVYNFDRINIGTDYLKTVSQEQFINFFKENIHGPNRRKLSLHVISTISNENESEEENEFDDMLTMGRIIEINDIVSFKCSQSLYPTPVPYVQQFPKKDSGTEDLSMTNMTTRDNVLERCEDIIKSENDDRLLRGLVLKNTMKVLLISDPTTDKSAAALHIDIGYMCDPDDLPGLAHLCEHMLFLGNETYPEPNNYKQYLSDNGGLSESDTVFDNTVYYFNVNTSKLSSALDRFAQSFLTPLFPESLIKREVNVIHSKYMKYLTFDSYLLDQLERSSANPRHPFSKFGSGNRETLDKVPKRMGINVRQRLIKFYEKYYSANVMSLCVLGAETLDELEEMVVSLFSQVRNKEIEIPICYEHPFNNKHFRTKWYMVPVEDTKNLSVSFSILDLPKHCEKEPICYITYLLREKYAGSFFSALRRRDWCTSIQCGRQAQIPGSYILFLNMSLTEKGIDHIDDIITLMFQCINMLKKQGPVEWIYNEYRDLAEIYFPFKQKDNSESYMSYRASKLREYPMKENLCRDFLFRQWKPELIDTILKCLTPKNIRIHVIGKAYEGVANKTARCGIKYKKEKISTEIINMWKNAGYNSEFHLPAKNVFIPSRFNLKPRDDKVEKFPTVIADTPFVRMWFKQDDKYLVPQAKMFFRFVSPYSQIDAVSFNLSSMHVMLSQYTFYEDVQPVNLAGIAWILKYTLDGLILVIQGFDDKQHILLEKIVDCLLNFKNDQKIFEILKKKYIKGLRRSLVQEPYRNVHRNVYDIISELCLMRDDLLRAAVYVTFDKFQEFIPQLFSKMHVECLIHGNIVKKEALDIATMIESKLKSAIPQLTPLYQHQLALSRELKLNNGCHFLYQTFNEYHKDFCTAVYYQVGVQSVESDMLLKLLIQIIMKPCVAILRTQACAHFLLTNNADDLKVTQGLLVVIQGNRHPRNVEQQIDSFMNSTLNFITKMSRNKFHERRDALLMSHFFKIETLYDQTDMFWGEIRKQVYNFDRINIGTDYLKTVSQEQFINFFKENIHGPNRRKLSLHVISTISNEDESEEENEFIDQLAMRRIIEINDIASFKCSQSLYPRPVPYVQQ